MAGFDKSKRCVVKHKTHKPFTPSHGSGSGAGRGGGRGGGSGASRGARGGGRGGGRGGFKVGPSHAPDGAYLGKAKKIKANLIANAKTKKRFFKSIAGEEGFADTKGKGRANENDDEDDGEDYDDEEERAQSSAPRRPRAGPSSRGAPSPFFQKTDLGRFAREEEDEEQGPTVDSAARLAAGDDARQRRRDRAGPAPAPDHEGRRGGDRAPPRKWGRPEELSSALPSPATAKSDPITAPAPAQVSAPRPHRTREEAVEARKKRQEMWNSTSKGGSRAQSRKGGQPDLGKRMQVLLGRIEERQQ